MDVQDDEAVMTLFWPKGQGPKHVPDGDILMERDLVCPVEQCPEAIQIRIGTSRHASVYHLVGVIDLDADEGDVGYGKSSPAEAPTEMKHEP
jgi:hypothetical protein